MMRVTGACRWGVVLVATLVSLTVAAEPSEWIDLFNGRDMTGWRASEHKTSFQLREGALVAHGDRSHLFYVGDVQGADFRNFELEVEVMTERGSNGGIYFHTAYQENGWPDRGFEVQVNNTHSDWRKTGGLYAIQDVRSQRVQDGQWFTERITVRGRRVVVRVDGRVTVDWTQPEHWSPPGNMTGRVLGHGTFALQGHDPKSTVRYRRIRVRPLPDDVPSWRAPRGWVSLFDGKSLNGWTPINGSARYEVVDGTIRGTTVAGSPNSFLCSRPYRDFELEFEVKVDAGLNSGVQLRSNSLPEYRDGRVHGYQVEIADNGNAGFIYDEARRGWLSTDRTFAPARAAFQPGQWNRYRVVCVGDHLRTWVNDVPVADVTDGMTAVGFLGLQVHQYGGPKPLHVQWRALRIKELEATAPRPLEAVVVTGGHAFEEASFQNLLAALPGIHAVEARQQDESELFEDVNDWPYDVIVFYNMSKTISPRRRANLEGLLKRGVGVVALHHTLAAYPVWPEFYRLIGARYFLEDTAEHAQSTYQHDLDLLIRVAESSHPVTAGLVDFMIHDEAYKGVWHAKDNHVLLTTEHAASDVLIAWTRVQYNARVCTIQLGHDHQAYENPQYRRLVAQAVRWVAQQ